MSAQFTRRGFVQGLTEGIGLLPGVVAFGVIFGVLAASVGMSLVAAGAMSFFVFSGTAQLLVLHSWGSADLLVAATVSVLAMNARYVLFGAAIQPWMRGLSPAITYPALFLMVDANWAAAMRDRAAGRTDVAVFVGSGLIFLLGWMIGTLGGVAFGSLLGDPRRLGLDFFLPAFFLSLACGFWKGRGSLLPFAVGAVVALLFERFVGGSWHVFAGGLAGSLAAVVRMERPHHAD